MSRRVTRANSRHALVQEKAAVPYLLRSRVPLGNASNVIGLVPKRKRAARDCEGEGEGNGKAKRTAVTAPPAAADTEQSHAGCDSVQQPVVLAQPADDAPVSAELQNEPGVPQCFSGLLLSILDVDSADAANAQMCSEYVRDIYAYLQQLEVVAAIKPHYLEGQEVTGAKRAIAIDWLMQVQREFRLRQETLFLTVGIIDAFLQNNPVPKKYLQLVCVTAMLIASKYEEIYPPTVGDFAFVTDGAYTCGDIRRMERIVLKRLNYSLGRPVPLHFLQRACKIGQANQMDQELATFLLELSVLNYDLVHVPPSLMAAAAFGASRRILGSGQWSVGLQHHTGYSEDALAPVMRCIKRMLEDFSDDCTLQEIKSKYVKVSSSICKIDSKAFSSERVAKLLH